MSITGYYMHYDKLQGPSEPQEGAMIKVKGQIEALRKANITCDYWRFAPPTSKAKLALRRIPFTSDGFDWQLPPDIAKRDFVYIRKPWCSKDFIHYLSRVREKAPHIKILCEVFTYPYDEESKNLKDYPLLIKDRIHRKKLSTYVDRVVTPSSENSTIFNIPTLKIVNGVDLSTVATKCPSSFSLNEDVEIICVATFAKWHGIDRVLKGLKRYYDQKPNRQVHLHLLGDGPMLRTLKEETKSLHLEENVTFYGRCNREQMDTVYDQCSFAIASLGLHRIGLTKSSTLKTREYLAKGIPFVYSGDIDVFLNRPIDFCIQVPADDDLIDISSLLEFHDGLYQSTPEEDVIQKIRLYAEESVGMDSAMQNVITYIKEICSNEN